MYLESKKHEKREKKIYIYPCEQRNPINKDVQKDHCWYAFYTDDDMLSNMNFENERSKLSKVPLKIQS